MPVVFSNPIRITNARFYAVRLTDNRSWAVIDRQTQRTVHLLNGTDADWNQRTAQEHAAQLNEREENTMPIAVKATLDEVARKYAELEHENKELKAQVALERKSLFGKYDTQNTITLFGVAKDVHEHRNEFTLYDDNEMEFECSYTKKMFERPVREGDFVFVVGSVTNAYEDKVEIEVMEYTILERNES